MRRANGSGNIYKMKTKNRKLRKPWRVRVCSGWRTRPDTGKSTQILETLGYYATRAEAEAALVAYKDCPYDIKAGNYTFKDVYEMWSEPYIASLTGENSARTITSAYRYCSSLYSMRIRDIRVYHLEECIKNAYIIPDRGKDKGQKRYASASTK